MDPFPKTNLKTSFLAPKHVYTFILRSYYAKMIALCLVASKDLIVFSKVVLDGFSCLGLMFGTLLGPIQDEVYLAIMTACSLTKQYSKP